MARFRGLNIPGAPSNAGVTNATVNSIVAGGRAIGEGIGGGLAQIGANVRRKKEVAAARAERQANRDLAASSERNRTALSLFKIRTAEADNVRSEMQARQSSIQGLEAVGDTTGLAQLQQAQKQSQDTLKSILGDRRTLGSFLRSGGSTQRAGRPAKAPGGG